LCSSRARRALLLPSSSLFANPQRLALSATHEAASLITPPIGSGTLLRRSTSVPDAATSALPTKVDGMTSPVRAARITEAPLSVDRLLGVVQDPSVGGIALFVGVVRDHDEGAAVVSLDYSQHPTAEAALLRCAEEAAAAYDVVALAVEHRVGHLEVGDLAVVVAVGAVHRGPALAACAWLIDTLKAEVPIWKEQRFASGSTAWVGLPATDEAGSAGPIEVRTAAS
jgi:molybdopterin synthase catalytic subunit